MFNSFRSSPILWASLFIAVPALAQQNPENNLPAAPVAVPNVAALGATESGEPEVSVDELIQLALQNNPQLPAARENLEAARQRLGAARAIGNPALQIVPGFSGNSNARDEEIILSQPLDVFGRRQARAKVAGAGVRRAEADNTFTERSLAISVKNAAIDLFAAQEAESLGQVQLEVAQLFRNAAARRAELGDVPPVQVQRADLELLRSRNDLSVAQANRLANRAALNQLVGRSPETPLRVNLPMAEGLVDVLRLQPSPAISAVAPKTPAPVATTPSVDGTTIGASSQVGSDLVSLRSQLLPNLATRPDIVGAQAAVDERRAQVQVLRKQRLPDVELQARRAPVTSNGSTALRAVVVVPLFDFGSNKKERRALEAEARGQEAQLVLLKQRAAVQVEQALLRLQQQGQTVERYRGGIVPQTLDLLRKTQVGYAQGASTYLEVLDAQRTLRQVQTEYLQALIGTRTGVAQLESALGAPLPANMTGLLTPFSAPGGSTNPISTVTPTVPAAPDAIAPAAPQGGR